MDEDQDPNIMEFNNKTVGKRVFVCAGSGFYAYVTEAIDSCHFKVKQDRGSETVVSIFDIRSLS